MFRDAFKIDSSLLYLNSGTHSLCPQTVLECVTRYQREFESNPTRELTRAWGRLWGVHRSLARYFGVKPQDLILRSNVTEVLNLFIQGATLRPGSDLVVTDLEYGATHNACRFRAERDGRKLAAVEIPLDPGGLTARALCDRIMEQMPRNAGMFVASHVMTGTGLALPLAELGALLKERGILFAIDGAHAAGALPIDFSSLEPHVDFYAGSLHKWMMGPKGTSFGWVPARNHGILNPLTAGWTTYEAPPDYAEFAEGNRFTLRMLDGACKDFAPFFALEDVLRLWNEWGMDTVRSRIKELQSCLEHEMSSAPEFRLISPPPGPLRGPLTTYELPQKLLARAGGLRDELLVQHRLQIALPLVKGIPRLRISPHFYNTEDEIRRGAAILKNLARISG